MIDMKGKFCRECKKATYRETSIYDDWDGKLHCPECDHETKRYLEEPSMKIDFHATLNYDGPNGSD